MLWPRVPLRTRASSVASQDTLPEIAARTRNSLHCLQLAVVTTQPRNSNARPSTYGRGQANHVDMEEVQNEPATVMGTLLC